MHTYETHFQNESWDLEKRRMSTLKPVTQNIFFLGWLVETELFQFEMLFLMSLLWLTKFLLRTISVLMNPHSRPFRPESFLNLSTNDLSLVPPMLSPSLAS